MRGIYRCNATANEPCQCFEPTRQIAWDEHYDPRVLIEQDLRPVWDMEYDPRVLVVAKGDYSGLRSLNKTLRVTPTLFAYLVVEQMTIESCGEIHHEVLFASDSPYNAVERAKLEDLAVAHGNPILIYRLTEL